MTKLNLLFEVTIDGIIAFTDFFIIRKRITLSEGILFMAGAARGFWPLVFGVAPLATIEVLTSTVVIAFFVATTALHLFSFFLTNLLFRIGAIGIASVLWCVLGVLAANSSSIASLAVPTFLIFSGAAAFIVVRLIKDHQISQGDAA